MGGILVFYHQITAVTQGFLSWRPGSIMLLKRTTSTPVLKFSHQSP